jgi:cinnamyl-alcohol dehydrogenase
MGSLDYIIDTVSASHPIGPLLSLLKVDGKMVLVGIPQLPLQIHPGPLIFGKNLFDPQDLFLNLSNLSNRLNLLLLPSASGRRSISGSCIGSIVETQEMLDFCGEKNITCTIEKVAMADVNTAMERLAKSDVRYRFVLDVEGMGSTVGLDGLKL